MSGSVAKKQQRGRVFPADPRYELPKYLLRSSALQLTQIVRERRRYIFRVMTLNRRDLSTISLR